MCGRLEALGGWNRATGNVLEQLAPEALWAPGSLVTNLQAVHWHIGADGLWRRGEDNA